MSASMVLPAGQPGATRVSQVETLRSEEYLHVGWQKLQAGTAGRAESTLSFFSVAQAFYVQLYLVFTASTKLNEHFDLAPAFQCHQPALQSQQVSVSPSYLRYFSEVFSFLIALKVILRNLLIVHNWMVISQGCMKQAIIMRIHCQMLLALEVTRGDMG